MKKTGITVGKALFPLLLALVLALALSACGGDKVDGYTINDDGFYTDDNAAAVAIILGNHANAMAVPEDAYSYISQSLDHAVYSGYACAIIADATPTKVELADESFFAADARNPQILKQRVESRKGALIDALKDLSGGADSPEVDLLAAVREAKNALQSTRVSNITNKQIIIIDTGISTTGDLDFVEMDFVSSRPDIDSIIRQLKSYEGVGVLPDLSGISVTFVGTSDGLAEVAAPQRVATTDKKFIKNLWSAVIEACGAAGLEFEVAAGWDTPNVYTEDSDTSFPYVSTVSFYHEPIINFSELSGYDPNNPDPQPNLPDPPVISVKLESAMIGFAPDKASYRNEAAAMGILRAYATDLNNYFKAYPNEKVWLVGTTAAVQKGAAGSVSLSLQRAETVKSSLIALGVPADKLLTLGLGARFPWAVDEFPNGSFDTNVAQANRAVWILNDSAENEEFNLLKAAYRNNELVPEAMERFSRLG